MSCSKYNNSQSSLFFRPRVTGNIVDLILKNTMQDVIQSKETNSHGRHYQDKVTQHTSGQTLYRKNE